MEIVPVKGIMRKIIQAAQKAARDVEPIECIILTKEEWEELQTHATTGMVINVVDGVRIEMKKSNLVGLDGKH